MKKALSALLLVIAMGSFTGCATTMPAQLPEGFRVQALVHCDAGSPFDASAKGAVACVNRDSIRLSDLHGEEKAAAGSAAKLLCFSPSGDRLAVAIAPGESTVLRILDSAGNNVAETRVDGRVTSLVWRSEKELLAGALVVKKFSFGTQMASRLYRWDGAGKPEITLLGDVTLRPKVARLPEALLYNQMIVALSPYRDEIAYTTVKDPPLFNPYLKVNVQNLSTGTGGSIAEAPLGAGKVVYAPNGESLVLGGLPGRRISLPTGKEVETWNASGAAPALSPSGAYLLLGGHLFHKNKEIATFPPNAAGIFLPDGTGVLIMYKERLYLVSGLKDEQPTPLAGDLERTLKLRALRSKGLITDAEYREQLKKESK
ncbi:hypothetical protein [Geomonas edaphica]|uniref:hypothetical protein n=1 Tax=Geomonas edaphica TaxID=2570226 RepID=UPI0010A86842|nr:hypothetical protein [Geomonas edaphica]